MKITRIYTGEDNESHFEDVDIPLASGGFAGLISKPVAAKDVIFRETGPDYDLDFHQAPRRQYVVNLTGSVEIEVGSGETLCRDQLQVLVVDAACQLETHVGVHALAERDAWLEQQALPISDIAGAHSHAHGRPRPRIPLILDEERILERPRPKTDGFAKIEGLVELEVVGRHQKTERIEIVSALPINQGAACDIEQTIVEINGCIEDP